MSEEIDRSDIDASKAPLMDHLIELRGRLLRCVLYFAVAFGLAFSQAGRVFDFLVQPLVTASGTSAKLIYTKLYEAFFTEIRVAAFAGICLAFPLIANELWRFVAPGLYRREQKALLPFLLATPILFTCGAALAYYVVMPTAFRFFLSFQQVGGAGGVEREALPAMGEYLDLVMSMILAFGVAFLLPVLLMLLERSGIITRQQLQGGRRYSVVAAFVVAAVLTPPDLWSQVALAIPLILLYEISIIGIWITERRRARVDATASP
ncbi:twin-arginine translocase subunit TatC [Sandarakinorhabdus sp.]|jgi:sec-independent protein translocase protein TatC|uniref:twin-arginine translocase subunit TatC n=1 Tax=Sandarakinorhabdus sp. TaxID=1916663 RepID=UPI0033415612